jgi:ligand-binding sensor domain-containing protein
LAIEIDPAGSVWFGTARGVARRLPDGRWERFDYESGTVGPTVRTMAFGADGTGYFGTYASGVSIRRPDGRWEQLTERGGLKSDLIAAVAAAPDGAVWIAGYGFEGSASKGYVDVLQPDGTVTSQTDRLPLVDDELIWCIRFDAAGRPWLATNKAILVPGADVSWSRESTASPGTTGGGQAGAGDLVFDAAGQAWVATGQGPALRQADGTYRHFLREDLPSNALGRLLIDRAGQAWASFFLLPDAGSGLALRRSDGTWQRLGAADGVPEGEIHDLALSDAGDLWVSAGNSVGHRDPQGRWTSEVPVPGLPPNQLGRLALDPSGQPWVASFHEPGKGGVDGVSRRQADGQWESLSEGDGIARGHVRALAFEPSGALWLGLDIWTGLPAINLSRRGTDGRWERLAIPGTTESLGVDAIAVDHDGATWFATIAGVARRDADGRWATWADDPALRFSAEVIRVDPAGNLWFGGSSGRVSGRVRVLRADGTWARIDAEDRLAVDHVGDIAFAPDGTIWFAGSIFGGGVSVLAPE